MSVHVMGAIKCVDLVRLFLKIRLIQRSRPSPFQPSYQTELAQFLRDPQRLEVRSSAIAALHYTDNINNSAAAVGTVVVDLGAPPSHYDSLSDSF
ncbi:hypothetical protein R1flu_006173 [Riccia fluitans]|uniref:Uncharacterized protein n=1 Tax=Riccia fluitans TaxID=41844 RepID=A0ABD1YWA9_9MARC